MKDSRLDIGEIVDERYHIEGVLSAGGFAIIYAALRLEDQAEVVIKALRRTARSHDAVAYKRFEREAAVAASLQHPNSIHTFGHGRLGDGHLYMVMERLHGQSLQDVIKTEGAVDPERVIHMLEQMLGALKEAHAAGVIHRDLKPANVFLCDPGPDEFVKVLDYGFARIKPPEEPAPANPGEEESRSLRISRLTEEGLLVGTPGYLAPEVCLGEEATARADLYALGLILHELLSGETVYAGKPIERARKQLDEDPPPLPGALQKHPLAIIVEGLTRRNPEQRYPSTAEVLADLELLKRGELTRRKPWWKFW